MLEEKNISYESLIVETTNFIEFSNDFYEIIKIDVEGSELDVLMAIEKQLSHCKFCLLKFWVLTKIKQFPF